MVAAPETLLRAQVQAALEAAFPDVEYRSDRLHESLGYEGALMATSPEEASPARNRNVLEPRVLVQLYQKWDKVVDNAQVVDPATIEAAAEAFRQAIQDRQTQGASDLWFLELERLWYPNDPTGNKTRFHAIVLGRANNSGVVETTI